MLGWIFVDNFICVINGAFVQQSVHNYENNYKDPCAVFNAWTEARLSDNHDYFVLNVTTVFVSGGKKLKKLLNIGLGKESSASTFSFLKKESNPRTETKRSQLKNDTINKLER